MVARPMGGVAFHIGGPGWEALLLPETCFSCAYNAWARSATCSFGEGVRNGFRTVFGLRTSSFRCALEHGLHSTLFAIRLGVRSTRSRAGRPSDDPGELLSAGFLYWLGRGSGPIRDDQPHDARLPTRRCPGDGADTPHRYHRRSQGRACRALSLRHRRLRDPQDREVLKLGGGLAGRLEVSVDVTRSSAREGLGRALA
jgi:hypothetical protein